MAKILAVDDDRNSLLLLKKFLTSKGHELVTAESGAEGLKAFYSSRPDAVLVDVMMPEMDGWTLCSRIREVSTVPILFITVKGAVEDKLKGFQLGADDFLTKPYDLRELEARIDAVLKRTPRDENRFILSCGQLRIDLQRKEVLYRKHPISVSPKEFSILVLLARNPGRVVSTQEIIEEAWGKGAIATSDEVKKYIWLLRKKLEENPEEPKVIVTVRGFGYRLQP